MESNLNKPSIFSGCTTFWCKVKRGLGWVRDNIPGIAGVVAGLAYQGMDAIGVEGKITDPTLTPAEENILTAWDDNYLTPFSLKLFAIFNSNIFNTALPMPTRLQFANDFILRIEAFKRFYKTNEKVGLSANALAFREKYTSEFFKPFTDKLFDELTFPDAQTMSIQDDVTNNDITPVKVKTTDFSSPMEFTATIFDATGTGSLTEITPSPQTQSSNPPAVITAVTENGSVISSNGSTTSNSNIALKVLGFLGLSYLGIKYAFKN